jgi:hypothetical protein
MDYYRKLGAAKSSNLKITEYSESGRYLFLVLAGQPGTQPNFG